MRIRPYLPLALCLCITSSNVAHAGILSQLRNSISNLWGEKAEKQQAARATRARASDLNEKAEALHDQLEATAKVLEVANTNYFNYWRQMRRTEAQIVTTRHRRHIVQARYNRRRILFGRRLAAMQRSGQLSYLQMFLGSQNLSDLTRRAYLFDTLTSHDAELQAAIRADRAELEVVQNILASEWNKRNVLQRSANRERMRVVNAVSDKQRLLYKINSSRYALVALSQAQERSSNEIGDMINELEGRRDSIIASYEAQAARERAARRRAYPSERRYRRQRVARRVTRIKMVPAEGGVLKPMPISELQFHTEVVPEESTPVTPSLPQRSSTNSSGWGMPVRGRLSSRYGYRYHPILRRRKLHTGEDMAAPQGTPFRAARNGRVLYSGWKKAYGNTVIIDHGDGTTSLYGHASKLGVRAGQPVKAGEYIGNVGSTGWSTGPHLHFEVRKKGRPVNPRQYLHRH